MKKLSMLLLFIAGSMLVLQSCQMEKRVHRPGYHVEWKKSNSTKVQKNNRQQQEALHPESARKTPDTKTSKMDIAEDLTAAHHPKLDKKGQYQMFSLVEVIADYNAGLQHNMIEYFDDECDTLFMRDGGVVLAIVVEINPEQIKYKRCDYQKGPLITVYKNDVERIVYPNGVVEEFEEETQHRPYIQQSPEEKYDLNNDKTDQQEVNSLAMFSPFAGIIGFLFSGLLFEPRPTVALILGGMAFLSAIFGIIMIGTSKDRYSGLGLAILGLMLSVLILIFLLVA